MQKKILIALLLASALPCNVHALRLGDIKVYSALNQPLDAEIEIAAAKPGEVDSLLVKLASEQAFSQSGVERLHVLTKLKFQAAFKADGTPVIKVTSREAIREPSLSFLVSTEWPSGRGVREYTVLLNTVPFSTRVPATTTPPEVTKAVAEAGSALVQREPEPAPGAGIGGLAKSEATTGAYAYEELPDINLTLDESIPFNAESILAAETSGHMDPELESLLRGDDTFLYRDLKPEAVAIETRPDTYRVEEGDTMMNIAGQFRPAGVDINQAMLAIMRYNPGAFINNNINLVRKGQVLRIPDAEAMRALSSGDALAEVREQNALWREYRAQLAGAQSLSAASSVAEAEEQSLDSSTPQNQSAQKSGMQLSLLASGEGAQAGFASGEQKGDAETARRMERKLALAKEKLAAGNLEQAELQSRIDELEKIATQSEGVINLKNQQLAKIQANAEKSNWVAEAIDKAVRGGGTEADAEGHTGIAKPASSSVRPDGLGGIIHDLLPPGLRSSLQPILGDSLLLVILAVIILLPLIIILLLLFRSKADEEKELLVEKGEQSLDAVAAELDADLNSDDTALSVDGGFEPGLGVVAGNADSDPAQMIDDESLMAMAYDFESDESDESEFSADEDAPDSLDDAGTKLDLAKAYIDMGDSESARDSLEEVIQVGNEQQKQEAEELLAQI